MLAITDAYLLEFSHALPPWALAIVLSFDLLYCPVTNETHDDGRGGALPPLTSPVAVAAAKVERACNSHSEAERKRRQRINHQLSRLRQLLPHTSRMDKAGLLTEVVREIRDLRRRAADAGGEEDEVLLDCSGDGESGRTATASFCCQDRSGLFRDVGEAIRSSRIRPARVEMATVGGRTKAVLVVDPLSTAEGEGEQQLSALLAALRSVVGEVPSGGRAMAAAKRMRSLQLDGGCAYYC
ncbi:unnamed protein product [Spirodela intermedia]|uniref:Uncharacterized protein n=1 Tax=Spirodela intermedia TaxID=51605 RepID=A0A7I8ING3_SPIIN|nr:unnamed protein product [Spirodela intermedia]CAA6659517.1 unnamed protein product [Spirodela intermedia]